MLLSTWSSIAGWSPPRILPYGPISVSPAANVFHYSSTCFEGLKAFRGTNDSKIRLFRPSVNMTRFNRSAARVGLPAVDEDALLTLIWKLVDLDSRFLPPHGKDKSLYIRPVLMSTSPTISLLPPSEVLLLILLSPVTTYYTTPLPISISTSPEVRAWPGGCGDHKIGPNYAPSIVPYFRAKQEGHDQNLWVIGSDEKVTEGTGMNMFFVISRQQEEGGGVELVTPPLDGLILPGVMRDSVIKLGRERLGVEVVERVVTMGELWEASREGRLRECFGTGTAVVVLGVRRIVWRERAIECGEEGEIARRMKAWIEGIQRGEEEHEWGVVMPEWK